MAAMHSSTVFILIGLIARFRAEEKYTYTYTYNQPAKITRLNHVAEIDAGGNTNKLRLNQEMTVDNLVDRSVDNAYKYTYNPPSVVTVINRLDKEDEAKLRSFITERAKENQLEDVTDNLVDKLFDEGPTKSSADLAGLVNTTLGFAGRITMPKARAMVGPRTRPTLLQRMKMQRKAAPSQACENQLKGIVQKEVKSMQEVKSAQDSLFTALGAQIEKRVGEFKPMDLANTIFAFAEAGRKDPPVFATLAAAAAKHLSEFNAKGLSDIVGSFAKVGEKNLPLFEGLARAVEKRIDEFNPNTIANTAWGFAKAELKDRNIFTALMMAAEKHAVEFKPQELAVASWAFMTAKQTDEKLTASWTKAIEQRVSAFNPLEVEEATWAFMMMGRDCLVKTLDTLKTGEGEKETKIPSSNMASNILLTPCAA